MKPVPQITFSSPITVKLSGPPDTPANPFVSPELFSCEELHRKAKRPRSVMRKKKIALDGV